MDATGDSRGYRRILFERARDIILFIRRDGRIVDANEAAEKAYGYKREELLSMTIYHLRAPETAPLVAEQMSRADSRGILFETVHRRKDGSTFPVEVSSRGATIDGQRLLLSIIRDISDRKRAERALQESEERFRALSAATFEGIAIHDGWRILEVVDSARLESRQMRLNRRSLDLRSFLLDMKERLAPVLDVARIRVEIPEAVPHASADPDRLERILTNLLSNALKYSSPDTEVLVTAERTDGEVTVSVADRGRRWPLIAARRGLYGWPASPFPRLRSSTISRTASHITWSSGTPSFIATVVASSNHPYSWGSPSRMERYSFRATLLRMGHLSRADSTSALH